MKALTAFNRKISCVNGRRATGRIAAFAALNWKIAALAAFFVGLKALTAFNRNFSGVNSVEAEK